MTKEELLQKIKGIQSFKRDGKRAPHKPLLILYALSQLQNNKETLSYEEVHENLIKLLSEYGPPTEPRPYYPFTRLSNDGIWQLSDPSIKPDTSPKTLTKNNIKGGFTPEIIKLLKANPDFQNEIASLLIEKNFDPTLHEEIAESVGFDEKFQLVKRRVRDPKFRWRILTAYDNKCAICGFDLKISGKPIAIEAAHIKWHEANGPDVEVNGLALCTMHHKLFDKGAFTLNSSMRVHISPRIDGRVGLEEWLLKFENMEIIKPSNSKHYPMIEYVVWHANEVFQCY